jgi:antitoxin ParD1/3/4
MAATGCFGTLEGVSMPTRNVVLTRHQEELIAELVDSGRYQNASEVLREGLRLVEQREAADAAKLEALREAARIGFDAVSRGEFVEFDRMADLEKHLMDFSEEVISNAAK